MNRRSALQIVTFPALLVAIFVSGAPAAAGQSQKVTLKNGKVYQVPVQRGLPVPFDGPDVRIIDLGWTAKIKEGADAIPWVWRLTGELKVPGHFVVTVTSHMDETVSTTFECDGPGKIDARFFPQAEFPSVWDGFGERGTHWFPFEFAFEDSTSGKAFQAMQWAQVDYRTYTQSRELFEKAMGLGRDDTKKPR